MCSPTTTSQWWVMMKRGFIVVQKSLILLDMSILEFLCKQLTYNGCPKLLWFYLFDFAYFPFCPLSYVCQGMWKYIAILNKSGIYKEKKMASEFHYIYCWIKLQMKNIRKKKDERTASALVKERKNSISTCM